LFIAPFHHVGEKQLPEGHVIHRLAGAIGGAFSGRELAVTSPQGRFAVEAAHLNGTRLRGADAWGKHLLLDFDADGDHLVHIHLGLIGKFPIGPIAPVHGQVRLRLDDGVTAADLHGPQWCRLLGDQEWQSVRATVGADPIRPDADPDRAWQAVHRSSRPIAVLLMDQAITAGVGNIYRAEVLFRSRIDPMTPGNRLNHATWQRIWEDLVVLMRDGVATGRIDTVRPEHTPEAMGRPPRIDRHGGEVYVYRRAGRPCLVCGSLVRQTNLGGRHLFWCPRCQRRHR
jgi:formamidopyrimidine-DNA glycosylase